MPMRRSSAGTCGARAAHQLVRRCELAGADALQAGDGAQQGGLAAAGRADQHADVARAQAERDVVDGGLGPARVLNAQFGDLDEHGVAIVDAYNSHLHQPGIRPKLHGPAPASRPCFLCSLRVPAGAAGAGRAGLLAAMGRPERPGPGRNGRAPCCPAMSGPAWALCLVVGIGVALVGGATAAAVTLFDFPGRRTFEWALLLPLAMPAYVVAYAYTDYLQFSGPLQSWLRSTSGCRAGSFPKCAACRRRRAGLHLLALPLCLPARAHGAGRARRPPDGGGTPARRAAAPPDRARGHAAGAAGHGRRRRAGADGDAGRLRRRPATSASRPSPPASTRPGWRWTTASPPPSWPPCCCCGGGAAGAGARAQQRLRFAMPPRRARRPAEAPPGAAARRATVRPGRCAPCRCCSASCCRPASCCGRWRADWSVLPWDRFLHGPSPACAWAPQAALAVLLALLLAFAAAHAWR